MKRIAIVYGYGQLANGELDAQSVSRCKKALDLYQRGKVDEIYITVGVRRNGRVMGGKMKAWLMTYGGLTTSEVILDARGLNTAGETKLCSMMLGWRAGQNLIHHGLVPVYADNSNVHFDWRCSRWPAKSAVITAPREVLAKMLYFQKGLI